jgi:hypothetical protein
MTSKSKLLNLKPSAHIQKVLANHGVQDRKKWLKKLGAGPGSPGFTVSGLQSFHYTFSSCISSTFQPCMAMKQISEAEEKTLHVFFKYLSKCLP